MKNSINTSTICLLFTFTLFIAVFSSCKTTQQTIDSKDLSYLYNPTKILSILVIMLLINLMNHQSYVLSSSLQIFFSEANPQGIPTAMLLVTVKLFNISQGKLLADTAVYNISIVKEAGKQEYVYNVPLKVEKGTEYLAEVKELWTGSVFRLCRLLYLLILCRTTTNTISGLRVISRKMRFLTRF